MNKPIRIWTKKYDNGKEWIELQNSKYYMWYAEENNTVCCFPICFATIKEKFKEQGRDFIPVAGVVDVEEFAKTHNEFPVFI